MINCHTRDGLDSKAVGVAKLVESNDRQIPPPSLKVGMPVAQHKNLSVTPVPFGRKLT